MLATDHLQELNARIAGAPCDVTVPREFAEIFRQRGPLPQRYDDRRRFVRFCRPTKALLDVKSTIPGIKREEGSYAVLLVDVSRSGASFLHSGELYPGEQVGLWFPTGKLPCTVVRCLRHNPRCYETGILFRRGQQSIAWLKEIGCQLTEST
jgi:hypothetical protein